MADEHRVGRACIFAFGAVKRLKTGVDSGVVRKMMFMLGYKRTFSAFVLLLAGNMRFDVHPLLFLCRSAKPAILARIVLVRTGKSRFSFLLFHAIRLCG